MGYDNVDVEAAPARGIVVTITRGVRRASSDPALRCRSCP
ncbi:MAG: hypothetical protein ACRYFW_11865 [Janthinobacterium lividum]